MKVNKDDVKKIGKIVVFQISNKKGRIFDTKDTDFAYRMIRLHFGKEEYIPIRYGGKVKQTDVRTVLEKIWENEFYVMRHGKAAEELIGLGDIPKYWCSVPIPKEQLKSLKNKSAIFSKHAYLLHNDPVNLIDVHLYDIPYQRRDGIVYAGQITNNKSPEARKLKRTESAALAKIKKSGSTIKL